MQFAPERHTSTTRGFSPLQTAVRTTIGVGCVVALCAWLVGSAKAEDWPQWRGVHRDGKWNETGLIETFKTDQIPHKWSVPIASGYSGPTVAAGRVYVTDRLVQPTQKERVLCFAEETGEKLWAYEYDCPYVSVGYQAGPRASVTVDAGKAYALGTMGNLHCFDAGSGKLLWQHDLNTEYEIRMPIWGIASAPLIDGDVVVIQVGGRNACLVGFDKNTGSERWTALAGDRASYAAPIMIRQAGKPVMVCWTGEHLAGLNAQTGQVYWKHSFKPEKMVISIATPVFEQDRLFVTSFYDGSLMLKLNSDHLAAELLWKRAGEDERNTDALHSIMSTPLMRGDFVYGVDSYGELRCLDATNGDRLWENKKATPPNRWSNIHMVEQGDRVWMFNEAGELVICRLSPQGFDEISRAKLIEPTLEQLRRRNGVCWAHPAFANRHVFVRNDNSLVCASLEAE